ncbi:MAG: amidohydrolase family protein [Burkholderiaceae bacterium]
MSTTNCRRFFTLKFPRITAGAAGVILASAVSATHAAEPLPIIDAHVHYSHDSVEMTPPARVIELMRSAGLRRALVSSSDDNGTQQLSALAPDLIIPGLRPYRRRGETGTWYQDPDALAYVENLLSKNRYASIGEFHLYGDTADLPIPKRIVELASQHNLILHAHSDADAVRRLFAHNPNVKILWAHAGFDDPDAVSAMLATHPNLWADLAFRSDIARGASVNPKFKSLFEKFPTRIMLGTDTYTPERIYFIPEHAKSSRAWLTSLPDEIARNIAWANAEALLMPVWEKNRVATEKKATDKADEKNKPQSKTELEPANRAQIPASHLFSCTPAPGQSIKTVSTGPDTTSTDSKPHFSQLSGKSGHGLLQTSRPIEVSKAFDVTLSLCNRTGLDEVQLDATMPRHGHGMNYQPQLVRISKAGDEPVVYQAHGLLLHMPGQWQWRVTLNGPQRSEMLAADFTIR